MPKNRRIKIAISELSSPPQEWESLCSSQLPKYLSLSWKLIFSDTIRFRLTSSKVEKVVRIVELSIGWKNQQGRHPLLYHTAVNTVGGWNVKRSHLVRATPEIESIDITFEVKGG